MKLKTLFPQLENRTEGEREIASPVFDSRKAGPGDLFFAIKGTQTDGHRYIDKAVAAGAVAVVHSDDVTPIEGVTYIRMEDPQEALALAAERFYGSPSSKMTVYGVTGTNGKSTTTCVIRDMIEQMGGRCGYMGTIAVRYGDVDTKPNLTTPDALEIGDTLAKMAAAGMDSVAMEVSSHGLAEKRTDGVDFDVAIFTNLTWDHLDFHKTMEAYFEAKQRLFTRMKPEGLAILNADDEASYGALKAVSACRTLSYGEAPEADYRFTDLTMSGAGGSTFTLRVSAEANGGEEALVPVRTNLTAKYNISNLCAAIAALHQTGHALQDIAAAAVKIRQVDGRMEIVENDLGLDLIVDYAHTPDGFEKIFEFVRSVKRPGAAVFAVFGSAGKRDKKKRPVLGSIAGENCDLLYLTEEDPRDERAVDIAAEIKGDLPEEKVRIIGDRYEAIETAIRGAKPGDMVLILGKGDEKYLDRGNGKDDWMGDEKAAAEIAAKLAAERA